MTTTDNRNHHHQPGDGAWPEGFIHDVLAAALEAYQTICSDGTASQQIMVALAQPDPSGVWCCRTEAALAEMRKALRKYSVNDDQLAGAFLFVVQPKLRDVHAAPDDFDDLRALRCLGVTLGLGRDGVWEAADVFANYMCDCDGYDYRTPLQEFHKMWRKPLSF
jgi:hypothetical protein